MKGNKTVIFKVKKLRKGFTLIELLIVVAIIGILAAVGATMVPGLLGKTKITAVKEQHENIVNFTCLSGNYIDLSSNYSTFFVLGGRAIIDKVTAFNNTFIPSLNNVTEASNNIVDSLFRTFIDNTVSAPAYISNNTLSLSTNNMYKNSTTSCLCTA